MYVVDDHRAPYRIDIPDLKDYAVVHETPEIRLNPDRVTDWTLTAKPDGIEVRWAQVRGPIGRDRFLVNRQPSHSDQPVWQLAAAVANTLSHRWSDEDSATRYRSARLFSHCLMAVRQWLAHERVNMPVHQRRVLLDPNVQDAARDQIVYAIETLGGDLVTRVGVPADPHRPRRCAGTWRPFKTTLTKIASLQRSELNVAACHTRLEMAIVDVLDGHSAIDAVVRNHGPERFEIPYKTEGKWAKFVPDFFARAKPVPAGSGAVPCEVVPHLVVEGKGPQDPKASEKARWTRDWWTRCADQAAAADGAPEHRWAYVQVPPDKQYRRVDRARYRGGGRLMSKSPAYEHGTTRPNNPSVEAVETASEDRRKARQHRKDVRDRRPTEPRLEWDRGPERKTAVAPMLMRAEQIDPSAWLRTLRPKNGQPDMFASFNEYRQPGAARLEWYEHAGNWSNRLIHADARRAMASLLEHEHFGGSVQMVYFDPPYGMEFDAKLGNDTITRRAFIDTYDRGVHSYLDAIRDTAVPSLASC